MLVKICGITTPEAAHTVVQAGADFIGFIFAPSKRQLTPERASTICASLPSSIKKVGVFVNESLGMIERIAEQVGLDMIQLHGDESPEFAEQLALPVIKAFPVKHDNLAEIRDFPCDFYLLDSPTGKNRGGNGTTFDWNLLDDINLDREKVILAGGLSQENVQNAITTVRPAGVDVSSGVETDGQKDLTKIKQFISKVRKDEKNVNNIHNA